MTVDSESFFISRFSLISADVFGIRAPDLGSGVGGVEVGGWGVFEESLFSQTAHSRNTKTLTVRRRLFWEVVVEWSQRGSRRGNFNTLTTLLFVLRLVFFC